MRHLTKQQIADILNSMDDVFDAHAAEKRAIGKYSQQVGQELASYAASPTMSSLQKFSMQFALYIDQKFGSASTNPQIIKTTSGPDGDGKIISENLAGNPVTNQEWKKVVPAIVPPP